MNWQLSLTVLGCIWSLTAFAYRPPSIVLVVCWFIAQCNFFQTGDSLPRELYCVLDIFPIAAVVLWRSTWHDLLILGLFVPEWWVYFHITDDVAAWWSLWALSLIQLIAAGPWAASVREWYHYDDIAEPTIFHGFLHPRRMAQRARRHAQGARYDTLSPQLRF